jgi:hypothetical protein
MAEIKATILIPDISGFTEFMTTTELTHSSLAINMLLDAIVTAVGDAFEVSEIEGDAVLLIRKDPPPSHQEILDICFKIFNAFHLQRKWMKQLTVCPCKACDNLVNLTLKFIVHHGPLAEIRVGRFIKHSGPEMIVAHRLLKNSIDNNEYLLMTEKVMPSVVTGQEPPLEWNISSEEFASIGKVGYYFTLLNEARKNTPEPPSPETDYRRDETPFHERLISANYRDVYMMLINIPERHKFIDCLWNVEQDNTLVFVGNFHTCRFENFTVEVSPFVMTISHEQIVYAETWKIKEHGLELTLEVFVKNIDLQECSLHARLMNSRDEFMPESIHARLDDVLEQLVAGLSEVKI